MQRFGKHVRCRALLGHARRVHHVHAIGVARDDAQVVRNHHQRDIQLTRQAFHQFENLRLDRDIQRGGRLVSDDELGVARERNRNHHALTHAAGELMRILVKAAICVGYAHQPQQLQRTRARCIGRHAQMQKQRLHDLITDGEHRVQRGHRVLKNHCNVASAYGAHGVLADRQQITALEQNAPLRHPPRLRQ